MATQGIVLTLFGRSQVGKGRTAEDSFVVADLADPSPLRALTSPLSYELNGRGVLMAVSDGMGGAKAGDVASSLTLGVLRESMSTVEAASADLALRACVEDANRKVFESAQAIDHAGMGATLTAILFHSLFAHIAEVGDSRAYLLRANRLIQLTRDQSYVQNLVDGGVLTAEQAKVSEYKNVILQAMGLYPHIAVAMRRIAVCRHDRFLVCSDGLSGVLDHQMILNLILNSADLQVACDNLIRKAVEHGSQDDITVVLGEVDGEAAPFITDAERLSLETSEVFHPA